VYRGDEYPSLYGGYILTDYCNGLFMMVFPDGDDWQDYVVTDYEGFGWSTFGESTDLDLYVANLDGNIYKITSPCDELTAEITVDGDDLVAPLADAYVWLLDGEVIEGATGQSYTPSEIGFYSVGISIDGCSVISGEEEVTVIGVGELVLNTNIHIYPNPANEQISITIPEVFSELVQVQVIDSKGSVSLDFSETIVHNGVLSTSVFSLSSGIYTLKISDESNVTVGRFSVLEK